VKRAILFVTLSLVLVASRCFSATILLGKKASYLEKLAARELRSYLYAATTQVIPIKTSARGDAIAVGTPTSNPLVAKLCSDLSYLGDQGYLIRTVKDGNRRVLVVTGNTPVAVTYGVYSLLEEYGFGFYLGGDAIPPKQPFRLLELDIARKPVFKIRGALPWYNFFNSPTTWDYEDYCFYFDQLAKSKNNFVGFHVYDNEPFAAYEQNGKYVYGEQLASTRVSTWGTTPMKTNEFGFGTDKYFHTTYFGSKPSLLEGDRNGSIRESQNLLRRALGYAKARGLKVCIGFEMNGEDPTDPAEVEKLENRLKHILLQYPMVDYVWVWEAEALGVVGKTPHRLDSRFGAYYRKYAPIFAYLNDPRRQTEAVRLAIYAREAYRILKENAPEVRMILSGWGGDQHLRCTDYFLGLDKILPKDIVFAALDNIVTSETVSANYEKLSPTRERWPIPWFEYDGDQWHPQPYTNTWLAICQDARRKASAGILGIHWRTRDVEEAHAAMSEAAWNPDITYEQFYSRYAEKCFGKQFSAEMASILMDLQSLGYRWIGGSGQMECAAFNWGSPTDPAKLKNLEDIAVRMRAVHSKMPPGPQADRLAYLYRTATWVLGYERVAALLRPRGEVDNLLETSRIQKSADDASRALRKLREARFGDCLSDLSMRITNKGELGILATVNAKAYAAYKSVEQELIALGARTEDLPQESVLGPEIVVFPINPNSTWIEGAPVPIKVVVHRDGCSVRVVYRSLNGGLSGSFELKKLAERYFEGFLPCRSVDLIEYYLEAIDSSGRVLARWPGDTTRHHVTLMPTLDEPSAKPSRGLPKSRVTSVKTKASPDGSVIIEWIGCGGPYYVNRSEGDGPFKQIAKTYDTWFEDRDVTPGVAYNYSVKTENGRGVASPRPVVAAKPLIPAPKLNAAPRPGSVRLSWEPAPISVTGYKIYEAEDESGPWKAVNPDRPVTASNWNSHLFTYRTTDTKPRFFRVVALDKWNNEGPASVPVLASAMPPCEPKPSFTVDFDKPLVDGHWALGADVVKVNSLPAAKLENGNYVVFPHRPEFVPKDEITLSFWVKLKKAEGMPVLLCHGAWEWDGYYIQVSTGRFRFYLHGAGFIDGGQAIIGKWHHIACVWDGAEMAIYQDGKEVARKQALANHTHSARNFYLGRYEHSGREYEFNGFLTDIRIYPVALTTEQIATQYSRLSQILR